MEHLDEKEDVTLHKWFIFIQAAHKKVKGVLDNITKMILHEAQ